MNALLHYTLGHLRSLVIFGALLAGGSGVSRAATETVCARVVIQIEQELTLEREGFEARLGISNGLPSALENFQVILRFFDDAGAPVVATADPTSPPANAKFFHRLQTGYTQPTSVVAGADLKVAYLIVPSAGAAGDTSEGTRYAVGATIRYTVAGREEIVEIAPDEIIVRPMPQLQLQYFLPTDVFGDDPLTTSVVEPVIPYSLGVRVINHSEYAIARKVKIQSGQPEIKRNDQDLLIDFRIVGSSVNGAPAQPTLLTDFGDIQPRCSGIAHWLMTSSLSGKFVRFTAEVAHAPDLGGALTSLIPEEAISTHQLLGQVLTDLPGRDLVPDYLATVRMDADFTAVQLHESDNDVAAATVTYHAPGSSNVSLEPLGGGSTPSYTLTVAVASALGYVRMVSPLAHDKQVRAVRSDGKVLPKPNAWISRTRRLEDGAVSFWLNVFDTAVPAGAIYTLTFTDPDQSNRPPVLVLPNNEVRIHPGEPLSVSVSAADPDGTIPALTTGLLPDGASFTDSKSGQGVLRWTPSGTQLGEYPVLFRASDGLLSTSKTLRIVVDAAVAGGFDAWREAHWPGVTDPSIVGPGADPDRDGLSNLLEYALDANPTTADDSVLPVIGVVKVEGQSYLTLTYRRRTDDPALSFEVVGSDALHTPISNWQVQATTLATGEPDPTSGLQQVKVRDAVPIEAGAPHRYLRLRVTREVTP